MSREPLRSVELLAKPPQGNPPPAGRPFLPFPVQDLPVGLREYVREGALALGCDPACLAVPALAVVASAIGTTRVLRLKPGWDEPCALWSVVVGEGGRANATAYRHAVGHVHRLQETLVAQHKEKMDEYRRTLDAYNSQYRKVLYLYEAPNPPARPALRRVVTGHSSIGNLVAILAANPRGTLLARHELDGWLLPFTRAPGRPGGRDRAAWLDLFFGGALFVDREGGEPGHHYVPRAGLSLTGLVHPRVLARLLRPDTPGAGMAGLLLMAMPPQVPDGWSDAVLRPEVSQGYHDLLARLLELDAEGAEGDRLPRVLKLSEEAMAGWVASYNARSAERAGGGGESAKVFAHFEGYVARLTLIHHVVSRVWRREDDLLPVRPESLTAGATLCHWFAEEAERVRAVVLESADTARARGLAEFIRGRGGRISVRELMRSRTQRYTDAASARSDLAELVKLGLARWTSGECRNIGTRANYERCNSPDTRQTRQNEAVNEGK